MFNLFCTLPALPAAESQPIPLRCIKVPPLPVTPNRAVVYARTADRHVGVLETQYNSVLAAAREDGCIVVDADRALEHLHQLWRIMQHNAPVKGYFHWSLVDNFEWERGWSQRFGLWGLDPATQLRTRRNSVDLYADICRTNSITSETVEKYCPEIYDRIYPV